GAPTPRHTSGVHARAKRPNLGPTRHTRGPRPAARLVIPLESTEARRRRTISCDRAAIRTAGPATWWITSCRSPVVVPTRRATCSGRRRRRGRPRTRASDGGAASGIERPLSHPQLIFSKSLTQPESVMDDVVYTSIAGLPPRWLEPIRIAAHELGLYFDPVAIRGWLTGSGLIATVRSLGGSTEPVAPFHGWCLSRDHSWG